MKRITEKQLESLVTHLNEITGKPTKSYRYHKVDRKLVSQIGNYHLSYAYCGVCLHQMMNELGGIRCPINMGYTTKRDAYNQIQAYIQGYMDGDERP